MASHERWQPSGDGRDEQRPSDGRRDEQYPPRYERERYRDDDRYRDDRYRDDRYREDRYRDDRYRDDRYRDDRYRDDRRDGYREQEPTRYREQEPSRQREIHAGGEYHRERERPREAPREASRDPCGSATSDELRALRVELYAAEARLAQLETEVRQEEEALDAEASRDVGATSHDEYNEAAMPTAAANADSAAQRPAVSLGTFSTILLRETSGLVDAEQRLRKLRERVVAPSDVNVKKPPKPKEVRKRFSDAAKLHSDCESELGELMSGGLPDPLEAAARALGVNEVSEIVRTDEGVQLLLRTA